MAGAKQSQSKPSDSVEKWRPIHDITPEVISGGSVFSEDILRSITSFDDALAMAKDTYGAVAVASEEIGDGFARLENKTLLIGVPMIFMEWSFYQGDFGDAFVAARVVTPNPAGTGGVAKYIIVDGGTGIADQLAKYTKDTGKTGGLMVKRGLRVSEYDTDVDGKPTDDKTLAKGRGATFYLDTSA